MECRGRSGEWILLGTMFAAMLAILFWPTPVDHPIAGSLASALTQLHRLGAPGWLDYMFVERAANVLLFMPLGGLIASVVTRPLWWVSGVLGLALSLCVEFGQAEFLPQRFASAGDLAANSAGALLGGAIVGIWRAARAHRSAPPD